ncbi:DUF2000 family protein [Buttiauxella warmboldiae]|uniref:DUF2000 family protein n=2 Tax=Buttiauxella warmboldiae TaxID=82993 RepID=A0A3N5DRS4_9ENTR|nr:DUF2000 family protein [Buttiauxella warmboldiae]
MFEDCEKKLYLVVDRNKDIALLMNAIAHISSGILLKEKDLNFHDYQNQESGLCAYLNNYPVIILQSKNSSQLATLALKCQAAEICYNFFTTTMLGSSSAEQINLTRQTPLENLDFVALAVYGDTEQLKPLMKKFSVFKA